MDRAQASQFSFEALAAALAIAVVCVALAASTSLEPRYSIAAVMALAGSAVLISWPERRIACVVLWILIHPLAVEKILPMDAAEGPQFVSPSMNINASDGPLFLLALFLIGETVITGRNAFRWSRATTVMGLILVWSVVSYLIHAHALQDGFTTSSPIALLQTIRLTCFLVLIQSAVRTRGEVITTLLAMGTAVLLQSGLVGIAYTTGKILSYAAATVGPPAGLQTFSSSGGSDLVRASGTVGQTNEQAMFHVFMTLPLIALFAARNRLVCAASVAVVAASALAIVLTFSRGAWIAFPIGLTVCAVFAVRRRLVGRKTMLVGASLMAASAAGLLVLAQPIYERIMFGDTGATESRLRMLRLASDLFQAHPIIGVGPGEFAEAALRTYPARSLGTLQTTPGKALPYPAPVIGRVDIIQARLSGQVFRRPLPVHNKYMLMLSELGVPGLALWVWLLVEFCRAGWRCSRMSDTLLCLLGVGGMGLVAAESFYMMVDLFHEDKPLEIMFFGPALVCAASRLMPKRPVVRRAVPPAPRMGGTFAAPALGMGR